MRDFRHLQQTTLIAPTIGRISTGALLEQAEMLLDKGIHPIRVSNAYDLACKIAFVLVFSKKKKKMSNFVFKKLNSNKHWIVWRNWLKLLIKLNGQKKI